MKKVENVERLVPCSKAIKTEKDPSYGEENEKKFGCDVFMLVVLGLHHGVTMLKMKR